MSLTSEILADFTMFALNYKNKTYKCFKEAENQ